MSFIQRKLKVLSQTYLPRYSTEYIWTWLSWNFSSSLSSSTHYQDGINKTNCLSLVHLTAQNLKLTAGLALVDNNKCILIYFGVKHVVSKKLDHQFNNNKISQLSLSTRIFYTNFYLKYKSNDYTLIY